MKNWKEENNGLEREFEFKNFVEAWAFMSQVALLSEKAKHHPTWSNTYNKVKIRLSTHDQGNTITEKDKKLAEQINALLD